MNENIQKNVDYCLNCKLKPCSKGCPLGNDIPTFIKYVKENEIKKAYQTLTNTTMIGGLCGRICPHQKQCQGKCVRGIKGEPVHIGEIEASIFDKALKKQWHKEIEINKENKEKIKKVAVIGSGPASLNASAFLAREGIEVTIFEKREKLGGILRYGIPKFRLDENILDLTIESILSFGVKVEFNKTLGVNLDIKELKEKFDAIFLGFGANIPWKMDIEGENLEGVYGGNTLLEYETHPDYTDKNVAVIGGGNVAMDASRTIKKLGAKSVKVIYRRALEQMPAEKIEIEEAIEEGVEILFLNNVVKIIGENNVEKIECIKTELVQKEGETRAYPVDVEGSNYELDMDCVVMAIGSTTNEETLKHLDLKLTKKGYIEVEESFKTSDEKIFAGGDLIGKEATVAFAAFYGREAANNIIEYLKIAQ